MSDRGPTDPALSKALQALQALDLELDQLRRQREHLPELSSAQIAAQAAQAARTDLVVAGARADALRKRQESLETEAATLRQRGVSMRQRLYDPATPSRELVELQPELAALESHLSALDDDTLAVMEELEGVTAEIAAIQARADQSTNRQEQDGQAVAVAQRRLDEQALGLLHRRPALAEAVPGPWLQRYSSLRSHLSGTAVASLEGRRCSGCHLELSAADWDQVRHAPSGTLLSCESCGRILVVEK